jgi:hypothetical protein
VVCGKSPPADPFVAELLKTKGKYQGFHEVLFGWKIRRKDVHFFADGRICPSVKVQRSTGDPDRHGAQGDI